MLSLALVELSAPCGVSICHVFACDSTQSRFVHDFFEFRAGRKIKGEEELEARVAAFAGFLHYLYFPASIHFCFFSAKEPTCYTLNILQYRFVLRIDTPNTLNNATKDYYYQA